MSGTHHSLLTDGLGHSPSPIDARPPPTIGSQESRFPTKLLITITQFPTMIAKPSVVREIEMIQVSIDRPSVIVRPPLCLPKTRSTAFKGGYDRAENDDTRP
jgi:hypothetical protein